MNEILDDDLIERVQGGDMAAFGELVDRHQATIRGWLRIRVSDWTMADDLAQEVFVTAFKRIATFAGESSFAGWLIGIARNHWRNFLRKHQADSIGGSQELAELIDRHVVASDEQIGDMVSALRACLEPLGSHARELLEQRYVIGRTVRDLAASSGRGYSALTMQLHRLREELGTCIDKRMGGMKERHDFE